MLCFTSGTTGDPKGAKLTHQAFVSDMYIFDSAHFGIVESDVGISFLPFSHVYEQLCMTKCISMGASTGFYSGDSLKLIEDIQVLKPTIFSTVPRLLNRIHSKILEGLEKKSAFS